jgi:hypothetical protein
MLKMCSNYSLINKRKETNNIQQLNRVIYSFLIKMNINSTNAKYYDCTSIKKPSLTISEYIERICNLLNINFDMLIMILRLIDKVSFYIKVNINTIFTIFPVCVWITLKFNEDINFSFSYFNKVFGIKSNILIYVEYIVLESINYCLYNI